MELIGKKIAFLGDSITEGAFASSPDKNFVTLFARNEGAVALNYGVGGTRIARQTTPTAYPSFDEDFVLRADKMDKSADVIVVFGGTNDWGHGDAPLGKDGDTDVYTFYGACDTLMKKLADDYPAAKKVVVTPLRRANEESPDGDGVRLFSTAPLSVYVDILKAAAEKYGYPVLDLFNAHGKDAEITETRARMTDGLHPDDYGHAVLAKKIAEFLKTL